MLMSLGVKMSQIPANRKSLASKNEFVKAAKKYYEGLEEEHKKGLEVIEKVYKVSSLPSHRIIWKLSTHSYVQLHQELANHLSN